MRSRTLYLASVAAALTIACGDPYGISPATDENALDTLTLGALHFTAVSVPSAFSIAGATHVVRTDLSIDPVAKTVTFKSLRDTNCGYRGLQTGVPQH